MEQGVLPISALLVDPQPGKQGLCGTRDTWNFRDKGTKALAGTLGMAGSIALFVSKPFPDSRARHLSHASHSQLSSSCEYIFIDFNLPVVLLSEFRNF